ncbi:MAG: di-trans,poly-cis-decaprenylcistransferase [Candidatus Aenigmarchaeota archaeon]|nr:di-trans,poly-cis-decaprenylcistransferase [Candidatus Aenigmarchaeota archaeon]
MFTPNHIGIIPDGNRRFGRKYGLTLVQAYERGINKLRDVCGWSKELGIKTLTVWGFSTENFGRSIIEKQIFFRLLNEKIKNIINSDEFRKENLGIRIIGKLDMFPNYLRESFRKLESVFSEGEVSLNIALGYGGRQELVDAFNKMIKIGIKKIDQNLVKNFLYLNEEPDLIIRTSGEKRTSGFLPWQSAYSEFVFLKPLWPELSKRDFLSAIREFQRRQRRFGR